MPAQDGLRFLFDIDDKITAKLGKIEARAKSSAAKIDKAFTRASKSQETSSLKLAALEQRRVIAAQSNAAKLAAIAQRRVAATQSNTSKLVAIEQKRTAAAQSTAAKLAAIDQRRMAAERQRTQAAKRSADAQIRAEERIGKAKKKALEKSLARMERESGAFKKSMMRLASAAAVAFAAVAAKALQLAGGYDVAMRSVQAKTQASGELMDRLSAQSREMGRTTVHSATEAARGQAFLAQAGFDANEVLSALPGTLNLATAGELGLAEAADIASNVLTGFGLAVSEADRVADVLALTAQSTNTNVQQMGDAMKYAAAVAASSGGDFEETAAAIGLLANAGFQGESGGTALRGSMTKLLNPTKKAQGILTKLGISAVTSTGELRPLHDIVGQFEDVGLTAGDAMAIFGQRAGPGMLALVSQGSDALVDLTGELKNAEGTSQKTADIMGGGLWGAIKKIQSIVESAYISLGQRFGPAVEKIAKVFEKLPAPIQEVVVVVGSLAAAMGGLMLFMPQAFGALTNLPGKLIGVTKAFRALNLTMLANPMGLVVAAIALLATGLYLLFTKTEIGRQAFEAIGHVAKEVFATAINVARATIVALVWWAEKLKPVLVKMIPWYVIKTVKLLGKAVAWVTGKLRDFNDHMDRNAKQARLTSTALEELGDVTALDDLSKTAVRLGKEGKLSAEVMRDIAKRAITLQGEGGKLDKKLQGIVKVFGQVVKKGKPTARAILNTGKATENTVDKVQKLIDAWTGATLKSKEFLRAFQKLTPEQKKNDRIMDQVLDKYNSMRKVLGPFDDDLEKIWRTTERLNPELQAQRKETEKLEKAAKALADKALKKLNKEQERLKKVAEDLNDRLAAQRRRLLNLPTDEAIRDFSELTRTWEGLNEAEREVATKEYAKALTAAAKAGNTLDDAQIALVESAKEAKEQASGYDLALAGLSGQMGGATGQALNLVIAMREHNKTQKAAAALGKKTEGSFGQMRMGAAGLATAFSAVGDMVGGVAGKVLKEIAGIAQAFATGGLVAGIIAGIMALGKAIWGLFSRGKKKRAAAAKKEAEAAKIVADAAQAAAETHAEAVETLRRAWLNLPTDQIVLDLAAIREAWDALGVEDRTVAFDDYAASLISARDAGAELTAAELNLITLFEEHQGKRTAMLARHKAEMAGFDSQIAALESILETKISEVDALLAQQEAELDALSTLQDAEIKALATRRKAALDSIMAVQNEQLSLLKETQKQELDEMKAAQDAELSALNSARNAQLGVVESAIQRELEDERIAAQLKIDLRKAGGDQEAIDAAHARADTSTERLLERDELNDLMAEAEARVRARYKDELDAINAHWDEVEAATVVRHKDEQTALEVKHAGQMTELEATHALELAEHNAYWDDLEELMELRHGVELDNLKAAHKLQLQALLDSLVKRRDALKASHATELADLDDFYDAKIKAILAAQVRERDAAIPDPGTVAPTNPYRGVTPSQDRITGGSGYRQHGGPVTAGQRYVVGEAGPEMFVPSQSGRIEPNGSGGGGGVNAKDLGRAVADALEGARVEVDGRKLGRLTVRHQPLAVAELGGRR